MKLGFWNRLAIVATAVGSFGGATYSTLSDRNAIFAVRENGYLACSRSIPGGDGSIDHDFCWSNWMEDFYLPGWQEWFQMLGALLLLSAITYGIVWGCVRIARWVWAGRT